MIRWMALVSRKSCSANIEKETLNINVEKRHTCCGKKDAFNINNYLASENPLPFWPHTFKNLMVRSPHLYSSQTSAVLNCVNAMMWVQMTPPMGWVLVPLAIVFHRPLLYPKGKVKKKKR